MNCLNCGNLLRENAKFCSFCGVTAEATNADVDNDEEVITEIISEFENITAESAASEAESTDKNVEHTPEDNIIDVSSEFADKFRREGSLFVVNETVSDSPPIICEKARKNIPWLKIAVGAACIVLVGSAFYLIPNHVVPAMKYSHAEKLYESGNFHGASTAFEKLGEYKDSTDYIMKCNYENAKLLFKEGNYPEAADAFTALNGYFDSDSRAIECMIAIAEGYIAEGNYDSAMSVYAAAGKSALAEKAALSKIEQLADDGKYFEAALIAENYCSDDIVTEYRYQGALAAKNAGDFKTAAENFYRLGNYSNSAFLANDCTYSFYMSEYSKNGVSEEIVRGFYFLGNFKDSRNLFIEKSYEYGLECDEEGDYASAVAMFKNCDTYNDAINELYKARYNLGKTFLNTDPASARSIFSFMSTYSDSASQKKIAAERIPDGHNDWYADGFTSTDGYYTTVFRKTDTLLISCTAGTDTISGPITLTLTLLGSDGKSVSADCENVRNSGTFSGSFSLSSFASGNAEIIIARKDNGTVLRTIDIKIV